MKNILGLIVLLSFSFSQTAMVSDSGESALGVWLCGWIYNVEYSDDIETDRLYLNIDYKTESGIEFGFDYEDYLEIGNLGVSLHTQREDDVNFWGGLKIMDITEESSSIGDVLRVSFGAYTDELININIEHTYIEPLDDGYTTLEIGKMLKINDVAGIGLSYIANTDYLDEGYISLTLGLLR